MDGFAQFERVGALFAEDFDRPEAVLDPEVIEPVFSAAELTAAREAAWRDGHEAGLKEAAQGNAAALQLSVRTIGEQFAVECAAAHAHAEAAAGAIARLLLDSLAAAFPTLCAQHGNAEVRSLVRVGAACAHAGANGHSAGASTDGGGGSPGDCPGRARPGRAFAGRGLRDDAARRYPDHLAQWHGCTRRCAVVAGGGGCPGALRAPAAGDDNSGGDRWQLTWN
ncbi:MAG: hypothetical protein WDN25_05945 [Acetobacteraceae bacterium]